MSSSPPWKLKLRNVQPEIQPAQEIPFTYNDPSEFSQYAQRQSQDLDVSDDDTYAEKQRKLMKQAQIQSQEPINRAALLSLITIDPTQHKDVDTMDEYLLVENQSFRLNLIRTLRLATLDWIMLWSDYEYVPVFFLLQKAILGVGVLTSRLNSYNEVTIYMSGSTIPYLGSDIIFSRIFTIAYQPMISTVPDNTRKVWKILREMITQNTRSMEKAIYNFLRSMAIVKNGQKERHFLEELDIGTDISTIVSKLLVEQAGIFASLKKYTPPFSHISLFDDIGWTDTVYTTNVPEIKWT